MSDLERVTPSAHEALMTDEQIRLRCLELAVAMDVMAPVQAAEEFFAFIKGEAPASKEVGDV